MPPLLEMRKLRLESRGGLSKVTELVSARAGNQTACVAPSQTFALSQFLVFPFSGRYRATDMTLYGFVCFSSLRELAEILIGLSGSFSEIFFKLYLSKSAKSPPPFFPPFIPENHQFSREFRQKFAQIIDKSVCRYWSTYLSLGDISYYSMLQILKSPHRLACVASTVMVSEADANPLIPVAQFSLSESQFGTYYCRREFH